MEPKRSLLSDIENSPQPKRPRRSCTNHTSYVKRDEDNCYYQKDFLESQVESQAWVEGVYKDAGQDLYAKKREHTQALKAVTSAQKVNPKKEAMVKAEKREFREPELRLMTEEQVTIISLRVELQKAQERISKLEAQVTDLSEERAQLLSVQDAQELKRKREVDDLKAEIVVMGAARSLAREEWYNKERELKAEIGTLSTEFAQYKASVRSLLS